MSDRSDMDRDIAEEDELASILRSSDRSLVVPPFADLTRRAQRHSAYSPAMALAAGALVVVVAVAGIVGWRAATTSDVLTPSATPSPSTTAAAGSTCVDAPASALVGPRTSGQWLVTSLDALQLTDAATNELRWVLRFSVPRGAPGSATVMARARIAVGSTNGQQHVLGYVMTEPDKRTVAEDEALEVKPCGTLVLFVRMAGPILDGTFVYTVTVDKVVLPEGGTVAESLAVRLGCSSRTRTCAPVDAAATPAPTATPVAGVLKPEFGIIYDGNCEGWDKGCAPLVRREGEADSAVGELAPSFFNHFEGAVSPDGRRAAYFAQRQGQPWTLYLLDGARPNDQRAVREFPGEIPALTPVWSADGNAIAFTATDDMATQGVAPKYSAIRTVDISTGTQTEVARISDGSSYVVVGWDKPRSTIAAIVVPHAAPASSYAIFSPAGQRSWPLDAQWGFPVSNNGRDVAATRCEGNAGCSLWTWKLEDFGSRADLKIGSGLSLAMIGWRPGTSEIAVLVGALHGNPDRIELWSASASRTIYRYANGAPFSAPFFRADGSALLVHTGPLDAVVVDLTSGTVSPLPIKAPAAPFQYSKPHASIRLGA